MGRRVRRPKLRVAASDAPAAFGRELVGVQIPHEPHQLNAGFEPCACRGKRLLLSSQHPLRETDRRAPRAG